MEFPRFTGDCASPLGEDERIFTESPTAQRAFVCTSIINFLELFEQRLDTVSTHISTRNVAMLLMLSLNMGCIDDQHARQQFKELAMQSGVNLAKGAPGTTVQQYLRWRQAAGAWW